MNDEFFKAQAQKRIDHLKQLKAEREAEYRELIKKAAAHFDFSNCEVLQNQMQIERDTFNRAIAALHETIETSWQKLHHLEPKPD